jgi:hypothetical protein
MRSLFKMAAAIALLAASAPAMRRPGDEIKPGFNLFSKQQDIEIGSQAAAEVRKRYPAVKSAELQKYVRRIGERLASQREARESGFTFSFTVINDKAINAFALPGGPAFVFTGLIVAAENEAQIAGVLGHEMSHVILRHGTNQASKANLVQLPAILAGVLTGSNLLMQLTNLGAVSLLLKFSRTDETEADALSARLMNEAGYNPIEMARFFEKLQTADIAHPPELLSDHPDPGNRVRAVEAEIFALPQASYRAASGDFAREKALVAKLPANSRRPGPLESLAPFPAAENRPSGGFRQFEGREFALSYPDNWRAYGDRRSAVVTIAPRDGIVTAAGGSNQVGYGVLVSYYLPESKPPGLDRATEDLILHLQASNPSMRLASSSRRSVSVESSRALVTTLESDSPYQGQTETDVLLTVDRPQGLFYMLFIAPQSEFSGLRETLDEMIHSIRFSN